MKKSEKFTSQLTGQVVTFTVSEKLNKLEGKELAPKKLAQANKSLKKLKTPLPK